MKETEKTPEARLEFHRDETNYDEVYLADLEWLALNADCKHVTLLEEVGCEWIVGIDYLID